MNEKNKYVGLLAQFILIMLIAIFLVLSLFIKEFTAVLEIIMSLTILVMSYNNQKIYKRKYATVIYLVVGIIFLVASGYSYIEVLK